MAEGGSRRRETLKAGAGVALLPLLGAGPAGAATGGGGPPQIRRRVTLGRTGLRVSDIGFGSSRLSGDVRVVAHALERGITYFDTAESYQGGASEETLGRALAGKRDGVVIASKVEAGLRDSRTALMASLDGSLSRLRADRIDVYFNHAVKDVARLRSPEWPELVSRAKQAGKIRFTGMSDFVAVQPGLPAALARAKQKQVGVVAMKTLRGAKRNDMRPFEQGGATFAQAAFRWTLSNANVDALVVTMTSPEQVDEYVAASGSGPPTRADAALLARYEARNGASQCRSGCGDRAGACPHGLDVATLATRGFRAIVG